MPRRQAGETHLSGTFFLQVKNVELNFYYYENA